jgi:hypothetical protein
MGQIYNIPAISREIPAAQDYVRFVPIADLMHSFTEPAYAAQAEPRCTYT